MSFAEDLTVFFNASEFAEDAEITPAAGGLAVPGTVIYDDNGAIAAAYGIEIEGPAALFAVEQWPDAAEPDLLEILFAAPIGPRNYKVRTVITLDDGRLALLGLAVV